MTEIWAIAKKTIQEAVRLRTPLVLLVLVLLLILAFPFALRTDGTLRGQLQLLLNYSLLLITALLSLQSVYLAISSFTGEIKSHQLFLVDAKPVHRWQFFFGKFFGLAILNAAFLLILGAIIVVGLYLGYKEGGVEERREIRERLFTSSRSVAPVFPQEMFRALTNQAYDKMRQENTLPKGLTTLQIRREIETRVRQQMSMVPYRYQRRWVFHGLPDNPPPGATLRLRYKFHNSVYGYRLRCNVIWRVGTGANIFEYQAVNISQEFHEVVIPASYVENGSITATFANEHREVGTFYFPEDSIEVLYVSGSFMANYARALLLIFLVQCFLLLLSLFASTFLSFPVAILLVIYILMLGIFADFIAEYVPMGTRLITGERREGMWNVAAETILGIGFEILPNFSQYILTEDLANGRTIENHLLAMALLLLLLLKGGFLAVVGCFIFNRREIARPLL